MAAHKMTTPNNTQSLNGNQPNDPLFLNGNRRLFGWTKTNPLKVEDKYKLKFVKEGSRAKEDIYMVCPCSNRPFKYSCYSQHNKGVNHIQHARQHPISYNAAPPATWERVFYNGNELLTLIEDCKKARTSEFNTAKLKRLEYIEDKRLVLCKCGSACTTVNKAHLKTDLHKSWVLYGMPLDKIIYRVRGFKDLVST